jgi:multiple sugar transport system permease protein
VTRHPGLGYAFLLPAFLPVVGLLLYPVGYDVWLSLTDAGHRSGAAGRFVGLHHYRELAADPLFWQAAGTTLGLVVVTALVELVVGVLTALLLWWRFWGRAFVFLSVFVPWAFPATFSAFAWYWLLIPPFPTFYTLHLQELRWWLEGALGAGAWQVLAIALMNVWRGSSIIAVFLLAGFNAIPGALLDAGKLEAPTAWQYFWRVVAPLSRRFLVLAALVALVVTYTEYAAMYIETGGRITVPVLGTLAFRETIQNGQFGRGAALALIPIPFAIALMLGCLRLLEPPRRAGVVPETSALPRAADGPRPAASPVPPARISARRGRRRLLQTAGLAAALLVTIFHLFPVYYTAVQAFRSIPEYAFGNPFWVYHPTFEDVQEVIGNPLLWRWGANTLVIFGFALALSLAPGLLAGYVLARSALPGGQWLARLMFATYFIPATAVLVPVYQLFLRWDLDDTITGLVLLYLTLALPFATWLFYVYYRSLAPDVEEVASLDGGRVAAFLRVVLPMSGPVLIAAGLFAVGMMGSDVLYGSTLSLSAATKTLPAGLGLTAVELDEWAFANAAILLAALPLIVLCASLSPYYVRGLEAALVEGA